MAAKDNQHVEAFEGARGQWTDHRFITSEQIRIVAMFLLYLVNLSEDGGWQLCGWSWKESDYLGCLVVKSVVDGVPSVVFTNAKTPIGGMGIFLRKMAADLLEWVPDRYRS